MGMQTAEELNDIPFEVVKPESITVEELLSLLDEKIALLKKDEFDRAKSIIQNNEVDSFKKLHKLLTDKTE
jgi:hypothetical protein